MFDIAPTELLVLGAVAIIVIPPKDLPKAMRIAGYWVGKARGVARQFRSGFDEMVRESELAEMEKRWRDENDRIMREHPVNQMQALLDAPPSPAATDEAQVDGAAPDSEDTLPFLVTPPEVAPAEPDPDKPAA
jgi:sec-independent protein translocase protein TatB